MARYQSPDKIREDRQRRLYDDAVARTGAVGQTLTDHFTTGVAGSDPRAAFQTSIDAAFDRFRTRLGEDVEQLRSHQVGRGRLDTGFGMEDEDRLVTALGEDMNREIASRALQAESLNLNRLGMIGSAADRYSDRAMAAHGGEYQTLRAQRLQDEADRARSRGGLLSAGISALGGIVGGPIGGAIANRFIAPAVDKTLNKKKVA